MIRRSERYQREQGLRWVQGTVKTAEGRRKALVMHRNGQPTNWLVLR